MDLISIGCWWTKLRICYASHARIHEITTDRSFKFIDTAIFFARYYIRHTAYDINPKHGQDSNLFHIEVPNRDNNRSPDTCNISLPWPCPSAAVKSWAHQESCSYFFKRCSGHLKKKETWRFHCADDQITKPGCFPGPDGAGSLFFYFRVPHLLFRAPEYVLQDSTPVLLYSHVHTVCDDSRNDISRSTINS